MFGARWQTSSVSSEPLRYLALGDSYTTCTGASGPARSWPAIVGKRLEALAGREVEVTNPAVNGFTALDLIDKELGFIKSLEPGLVTVLIGVNDLVRGRETRPVPGLAGDDLRRGGHARTSVGTRARHLDPELVGGTCRP